MDDVNKLVETENYKKLINQYDQGWMNLEKRYKDKINQMNEKIYNHGLQLNNYLHNEKEPFYLKNDHDFNRRLAEIKANDKEAIKHDQNPLKERIRMVYYN